jgi:DNA-binding response OmpR family regulator
MEKGKILLVNNVPRTYERIRRTIDKYHVDICTNPEEAIGIIEYGDYRVVISDYDFGNGFKINGKDIAKASVEKGTLLTILTREEDKKREAWKAEAIFMLKEDLIDCFEILVKSNTNGRGN